MRASSTRSPSTSTACIAPSARSLAAATSTNCSVSLAMSPTPLPRHVSTTIWPSSSRTVKVRIRRLLSNSVHPVLMSYS
jgi:hypothetical protein